MATPSDPQHAPADGAAGRTVAPEGVRRLEWPLGDDLGGDPSGQVAAPVVVGVGDLRATNAAAVLAAVRSAARPPRLASLAEATRLSRPTVEVLVDDLIGCGLIEEAPAVPARGLRSPGRPARRFRFQPGAAFVAGVDVRPHMISACLADLDGRMLTIEHRKVRADLTGRTRAAAVTATVRAAIERAGVAAGRVRAATVGTPGLVEQGNTRVRYVDNMKSWAETDIAAIVADELGCPVAVENDANLAALGEHWRGLDTPANEMLFVLLAERLGAGIITGGRLLRGHHGAAGEIGFIRFPGHGEAGEPGIGPYDGAVIAAAAAGDAGAIAVLESAGRSLAEGIAPVLLALDPAVVVLGTSRFARPALRPVAELLRGAAERRSAGLLVDRPEWRLSALGDQAILVGAVRFALSAVERVLRTRPTGLFS